jgi:hypothetical protein
MIHASRAERVDLSSEDRSSADQEQRLWQAAKPSGLAAD